MTSVVECKKCLYTSDHPYGITFDDNGICSGCAYYEEKFNYNWKEKKESLLRLVKKYKSKKSNNDCIIHVDGTAQSFYIVHLVKNILEMNPILVNYNSQFNTDIGIKNIAKLITKFDTNYYQLTTKTKDYKIAIKHSLQKLQNIYWPYLAGRSSLAYRLSIKKKIPLVINGAIQTNEQVGMFSHDDNIEFSRWYRMEHDLGGYDENSFISASDTISDKFFEDISYPNDNELIKNGTKGIFLGNYFKWDPTFQNMQMLKFGFTPQRNFTSFDSFENAGCSVYFGIHDILRYFKCNHIKAREHLSREIRFNRVKKDFAKKIYHRYLQNLNLTDYNLFFEWLDVSSDSKDWLAKYFLNIKKILRSKRTHHKILLINDKYYSKSVLPKEYFKIFGKGI